MLLGGCSKLWHHALMTMEALSVFEVQAAGANVIKYLETQFTSFHNKLERFRISIIFL
jgi:hypothetical protein